MPDETVVTWEAVRPQVQALFAAQQLPVTLLIGDPTERYPHPAVAWYAYRDAWNAEYGQAYPVDDPTTGSCANALDIARGIVESATRFIGEHPELFNGGHDDTHTL